VDVINLLRIKVFILQEFFLKLPIAPKAWKKSPTARNASPLMKPAKPGGKSPRQTDV